MGDQLLNVENLTTKFSTKKGPLTAVNDVSFKVNEGETVCIVGESGCGKSMTALSIMRLLAKNGRITNGTITFEDKKLEMLPENKMRQIRGNDISMIFQEPMTALNPVFSIGYQLRESLLNHVDMSTKEAHKHGIELLEQVGIPSPKDRMSSYPHELSGEMRQRVMIAMALACKPKLLIADEPTTALDVTIQAQILELIQELKDDYNMGVLLITHDMGVVAEVADNVIVMYGGQIVEEGTLKELFSSPKHPYTEGLLKSVPNVDDPNFSLEPIPGSLPNMDEAISGCRFHPRCKYVMDKCKSADPDLFTFSSSHYAKCWLYEKSH